MSSIDPKINTNQLSSHLCYSTERYRKKTIIEPFSIGIYFRLLVSYTVILLIKIAFISKIFSIFCIWNIFVLCPGWMRCLWWCRDLTIFPSTSQDYIEPGNIIITFPFPAWMRIASILLWLVLRCGLNVWSPQGQPLSLNLPAWLEESGPTDRC